MSTNWTKRVGETQKWGHSRFIHMKIYFSCSIRGIRPRPEVPQLLIDYLKGHGAVLTEHIGTMTHQDDYTRSDTEIFRQDIAWLQEADVVIAEVTGPSLGVGYEIGIAESMGKPTLCLCQDGEKRLSAMIKGNRGLTLRYYEDVSGAYRHINEFLESLNAATR